MNFEIIIPYNLERVLLAMALYNLALQTYVVIFVVGSETMNNNNNNY